MCVDMITASLTEEALNFTYNDIEVVDDKRCIISGADLCNTDMTWPVWLIEHHSYHRNRQQYSSRWELVGSMVNGEFTRSITVNDKYHTNYTIQSSDVIILLKDNTLRVVHRCPWLQLLASYIDAEFSYPTPKTMTVSVDSSTHDDETGCYSWNTTSDNYYWDDDGDLDDDGSYNGWPSFSSDEDEEEHTHLGWQLTTENRCDNSNWPKWMHHAWQLDSDEWNSVSPYPKGTGTGLISVYTSAGQRTVDWCDWLVYNTKTHTIGVCSNQFYTEVLGGR
jgi:hypothetical protein